MFVQFTEQRKWSLDTASYNVKLCHSRESLGDNKYHNMHVRILTRHSKDGRTKPDHSTSLPPSVSSATQSCLTLCNPLNCSPTDSSVHGILQARIPEWVAKPYPGDLPDPGIEPTSLALQVASLPLSHWGRPREICRVLIKSNQPILKGKKSWIFIGRTDVEAEAPIPWPPDAKSWLIEKDPDARKDWRQEEKGTIKDKMGGWHLWFNGHEFEQIPGDCEGQGSLTCCSPWGHKKSDMTEQLNNG